MKSFIQGITGQLQRGVLSSPVLVILESWIGRIVQGGVRRSSEQCRNLHASLQDLVDACSPANKTSTPKRRGWASDCLVGLKHTVEAVDKCPGFADATAVASLKVFTSSLGIYQKVQAAMQFSTNSMCWSRSPCFCFDMAPLFTMSSTLTGVLTRLGGNIMDAMVPMIKEKATQAFSTVFRFVKGTSSKGMEYIVDLMKMDPKLLRMKIQAFLN
jgi:hypothetical protein